MIRCDVEAIACLGPTELIESMHRRIPTTETTLAGECLDELAASRMLFT